MSHSKVRQCYYLTLIVMGKSTIKLQTERNTIELAKAFHVYVQIVICNCNFSDSVAKRNEKSVLYFNLLQNFSFRNDHSIEHHSVPNTAGNTSMCKQRLPLLDCSEE